MKKLFTFLIAAALSAPSFAQVYEVGGAKSFTNEVTELQQTEVMPAFDLEAVLTANAVNSANKVGPYMFGFEHVVNYTVDNDGVWETLPNGDRIWRLRVKSEGALSLNFKFDDFVLSPGAHIHIYNLDGSMVLGAYTARNNNVNNELGTDLIKGDEVIIELFEPAKEKGQTRLMLGMIVHGYHDIMGWYQVKGLNDSGGCNMDVICTDGDPWRDEIRSVARIVNGGGVCTGTLVNNTAQDGTPYFLTADHCGPGSMGSYAFQFHYDSPVCGSQVSSNSSNPGPGVVKTINGSVLRANNSGSDFGLLELNATPTAAYGVYYAGWDNSGATPQSAVGIHHPSGDVKKISFDDDPLTGASFGGAQCWRIEEWERLTTTEPGSSGSGLWNENHHLIGQLYGGAAYCGTGNSVNDYYGKFSTSWNGTSASNRLSDWLDPLNTGATTLDGYNPFYFAEVDEQQIDAELVKVFPNPSNDLITIRLEDTNEKIISVSIVDIMGKVVLQETINNQHHSAKLSINSLANGTYIIQVNTKSGVVASRLVKQ